MTDRTKRWAELGDSVAIHGAVAKNLFGEETANMVYERYGQERAARIRRLARRVEGTADYDLRQLEDGLLERLEDALIAACDPLDVAADALREQQHRTGTQSGER